MRRERFVTGILAVIGVAAALTPGSVTARQAASPQQVQVRPATAPPAGQTAGRGANTVPAAPLVSTGLIVGRVIDANGGRPIAGAIVTLTGGPPRSAPAAPAGAAARPGLPALPPPRILTDNEGRFAFRSLTRGNYNLSATRTGYTAGAYGRTRPEGPSRPIQLDDNERMGDVAIRMFKFASISGLVTDEAGEPIVNVQVRADRRVLQAGRRVLTQGSSVQTDDRGMYRLFNLTPGDYVVSVPMVSASVPATPIPASNDTRQNLSTTAQNINIGLGAGSGGMAAGADSRFLMQTGGLASAVVADGAGRWRAYATTYYPGALKASSADPITLASGDDRSGIDLAMRYLPTSSVSGVVMGPTGPAVQYALRLVPSDTGEWTADPEIAAAVTDASGAFTFLAVPAGQYVIQVVRIPRDTMQFMNFNIDIAGAPASVTMTGRTGAASNQPPPEPLLWALAPVSVGDADVNGVGLALREGLSISGRLEFSGTKPRPDAQALQRIPLVVEPVNGRDAVPINGPSSQVKPDGRFATAPRPPGKYFLRVGGMPNGFIVQSITVNGADATEVPFDLTGNVNAVITFTDLISSVSGTVHGIPAGADPPAVVIFPADSTAWKDFGINPSRMRLARAPGSGTFSFGSLIAGDYYAVAIRDEFSSDWQNPAYLEALSRAAQRFTLNPGDKRTLDLALSDVRPPAIGREAIWSPGSLDPGDTDADSAMHGPWSRTSSELGSIDPGSKDPGLHFQDVRDGRPPAKAGPGSISGVVMINDGTPRPARLARVSVSGAALNGERIVLTDDAGRFTAAWLPAGDYTMMVTKPAYLTAYYGAKRAGSGPGTAIHVDASHTVTGIEVTLQRGAVVSGMVLDPLGAPAPGVRVQLQRYTRREGERLLGAATAQGISTTDDHGAYRLYGIQPGTYSISVTPPSPGSNVDVRQLTATEMQAAIAEAARPAAAPVAIPVGSPRTIAPAPPGDVPTPDVGGRSIGFSPVYYPGTTREQEAQEFPLAAGQELNGINIQIALVPTARVEGRVIGVTGQQAQSLQITLQRVTATTSAPTLSVRQQEGAFQAVGVTAGRYLLSAFLEQPRPQASPGTPPPAPNTLWAQQELDVNGQDQLNLTLTLGPMLTMSGRLVFDGVNKPSPKNTAVRLEAAGWPAPSRQPQPAVIDPTGAFTISGIVPGKYRLTGSASPPSAGAAAWTPLSATLDGQDALVTPIEIRGDRPLTNAVVTLTDQPAEVSGTLIDGDGRPVAGLSIVLFPTDRAAWTMNSTRVNRTTRSGVDGAYRFTSTLPGEYYLVMLSDFDQNDWSDPAFKEQLVGAGTKLAVAKSEKKVLDFRLAK